MATKRKTVAEQIAYHQQKAETLKQNEYINLKKAFEEKHLDTPEHTKRIIQLVDEITLAEKYFQHDGGTKAEFEALLKKLVAEENVKNIIALHAQAIKNRLEEEKNQQENNNKDVSKSAKDKNADLNKTEKSDNNTDKPKSENDNNIDSSKTENAKNSIDVLNSENENNDTDLPKIETNNNDIGLNKAENVGNNIDVKTESNTNEKIDYDLLADVTKRMEE